METARIGSHERHLPPCATTAPSLRSSSRDAIRHKRIFTAHKRNFHSELPIAELAQLVLPKLPTPASSRRPKPRSHRTRNVVSAKSRARSALSRAWLMTSLMATGQPAKGGSELFLPPPLIDSVGLPRRAPGESVRYAFQIRILLVEFVDRTSRGDFRVRRNSSSPPAHPLFTDVIVQLVALAALVGQAFLPVPCLLEIQKKRPTECRSYYRQSPFRATRKISGLGVFYHALTDRPVRPHKVTIKSSLTTWHQPSGVVPQHLSPWAQP